MQGREEEVRARPWHQVAAGTPTPSYQPPVLSEEAAATPTSARAAPGGCGREGGAHGCVPAERGPQSRRQMWGQSPAPLEPWLGAAHWSSSLVASVLKKTLPQMG